MIDWKQIARSLNDKVILPMEIAGNHLATHAVLREWPDWRSDPHGVLEEMGAGLEYDAWCCWSLIMSGAAAKRDIKI